MPRIIEQTVYQFSELSDKAKEKARDWFRSCSDSPDLDNKLDDFIAIADLIGLELSTRSVQMMNGKTRQEAEIYYSVAYCQGDYCQGDYAAFAGTWKYKPGCLKAINDYAPQDSALHAIVSDWQALQKKSFYRLRAECTENRGYQTAGIYRADTNRYDDNAVDNETEKQAGDIVRRLASWLYSALRDEVDYQSSDEYVDDGITANEYEFFENGERV